MQIILTWRHVTCYWSSHRTGDDGNCILKPLPQSQYPLKLPKVKRDKDLGNPHSLGVGDRQLLMKDRNPMLLI